MRKLLVAVLMLAMVGTASAAIIPTLATTAPSAVNPGGTTFLYTLALAEDTKLDTSLGFEQALVIYDFAGYIDGSIGSASGNWVTSTENVGPVIDPEIDPRADDNPSVVNLVFRYIGPVIVGPQDAFDVVFADSIFNQQVLDRYQGQGTKLVPENPLENETPTGTDGNVAVPAIPEPSTMSLLGIGCGLAAFARVFKRKVGR